MGLNVVSVSLGAGEVDIELLDPPASLIDLLESAIISRFSVNLDFGFGPVEFTPTQMDIKSEPDEEIDVTTMFGPVEKMLIQRGRRMVVVHGRT